MAKNTRDSGQNRPGPGYVTHLEIAIVTDNVDTEKLGRVKVSFPTQPGDVQSQWVRLANPMAGPDRGFYTVPEKDDEVLVGYLQGDIRHPVVLGSTWNGPEKPPAEADSGMPGPDKTKTGAQWSTETFTAGSGNHDKNDRRLWKSRSGHLFAFDDTDGKESVQIWDKDHNLSFAFDSAKKLITISNTQGDLHIRTKNDLYLEAGHDIKIRAGNDLTQETGQATSMKAGSVLKTQSSQETSMQSGSDFSIDSTKNVSIKSKVDTTMEAVNFTAKGSANATLQGGAMAVVKGGVVTIN